MATPFFSTSWFKVAELRPQLRAHARVHRHRYRGEIYHVVDDGASGKSHRLSRAAWMLVGRMDGRRSVDALWQELVAELDEDAPTQDDVIQILSQLHAADLLQSDAPPDTVEALERQGKQRRQLRSQNMKSPLSFRVPLWDPDDFLTRTAHLVRPLLSPVGALLWLALVVPAVLLAGIHWDELTANLSDRVLATDNLLILGLCYPLVKALHELGHGYVAKAYGGQVRETGVMFLVFFPAPYVDASSAAALRSKWRRALVGSAGMIVEVAIASLAMFAWVLLEPGMLRSVAYNVMVIAGVSSLLVNANPLLRFDGYYILADLIEIPNLGSRANQYWSYLIDRYVFRTEGVEPFPGTRGEKNWFLVYAPAAFVARMVMLLGIALFVGTQFFIIGVLLALWSLATGLLLPLWKMISHVFASPQLRRNRGRALVWSGGAVALLALLLFVAPLPHHTNSEGVVWLPEEAHVRAGTDGRIRRLIGTPGSVVMPGQRLVEAEHPALEAELATLRWSVREMEAKLQSELTEDRAKAEATRVELAEARDKLAEAIGRHQRLAINSATQGVFALAGVPAGDMVGRHLRKGDLVGYVAPPRAEVARVLVPQADIELVRERLRRVRLKLAHRAEDDFTSVLVREVPMARDELPNAALGQSGGGTVATDPRDPQGRRALDRIFQFDVALPPELARVPFGTRVFVRFEHAPEPLGFQVWRRVRQTLLTRFGA